MRRAALWGLLAAASAAGAETLDVAGLPSPTLFAALLCGLAAALLLKSVPAVPHWAFRAAQAVTGVVLGSYVQSSSLGTVAHSWLPVTLVSAATLALSLAAGTALARFTTVDPATASLGLVAGGASGIVGMASDLGADSRLVAFLQYLRVLVVVLLTPVLVAVAFGGGDGGAGPAASGVPAFGDVRGWGLTVAAVVAGAALATALRVPAASLLGPMVLTAVITLAHPFATFDVPPALREIAFAVIGLQVGLGFTTAALRQVGRLLVPALVAILALLASCFGLALLLTLTTSASLLDSYLATTPGGLYAVLATAYGSHADTTFIVAIQTLRLFVMILLAPLVVRRRYRAPATTAVATESAAPVSDAAS